MVHSSSSADRPIEQRNPYAVLALDPVALPDMRKELKNILDTLYPSKESKKDIPANAQDYKHRDIVAATRELDKFERGRQLGTVANAQDRKRQEDLAAHVLHVREYLSLRQLIVEHEAQEKSLLQAVSSIVELLPPGVFTLPESGVTRQVLRDLMSIFADRVRSFQARSKKKKKVDSHVQAEEAQGILGDLAIVEERITSMRTRAQLLAEAVELERTILGVRDAMYDRFTALVTEFNPEAHPGDAWVRWRYEEAVKAYETLDRIDAQGSQVLTTNLVFGTRAELWTKEMQRAAAPASWALAPLFTQEVPLRGATVPCESCRGSGTIPTQGTDDYFPVPVVCSHCDGHGAEFECVVQLRKALQQLP